MSRFRFRTRTARRGLATAVVFPALAVPALLAVQWPFDGLAPTRGQTAVAATAPAGTPVIHVSPNGNDSADGSAGAPLRTPQRAVDRLGSNGGVVELAGGRYAGQRIVLANRRHVVVRAAAGARPVLDATGLAVPAGTTGVVEVRDGADITITGLEITGYRTRSLQAVPVGIYATGATSGLRIEGNHVHHLGNDNRTAGSFDINAHGIAVYGRSATASTTGLVIADNEVDHLVLGASETVVVNGNVDGFRVTGNSIHDNNNIGIDLIGFERTISGPARFTEVNRARNGVVSGNVVTRIISEGNPAYDEGDGYCNCAGGIYVDGAARVVIENNVVADSDIGLEVASEWARGRTNDIVVRANMISGSRYVGLAVGGYDRRRGEAFGITVTGNTLRGNNTLDDGSPEILLQYYVHDSRITGNSVTTTNRGNPLLVSRVQPAGDAAKNANLTLDSNAYAGPVAAGSALFVWNGRGVTGLANWTRISGQDANSTWTQR